MTARTDSFDQKKWTIANLADATKDSNASKLARMFLADPESVRVQVESCAFENGAFGEKVVTERAATTDDILTILQGRWIRVPNGDRVRALAVGRRSGGGANTKSSSPRRMVTTVLGRLPDDIVGDLGERRTRDNWSSFRYKRELLTVIIFQLVSRARAAAAKLTRFTW